MGRGKRGRPPKFGRPGQVVALTLPAEVVSGLQQINPDLAWAIVTLFEKTGRHRTIRRRPAANEAELVAVGPRSLIVVPRQLFVSLNLPGISILPLHDDRAFLALGPDRGLSDLVLAVDDRLRSASLGTRQAAALRRLRNQLQQWRRNRRLRFETRSIIVVDRARSRNGVRA